MVERHRDLHKLIAGEAITRAQQDGLPYIIVVGEVGVGNGYCCGSHDSINETIGAARHGNVIDPNIAGSKDGNPISVAVGPDPKMLHRIPDTATAGSDDVMDPNSMNDYVLDELYCDSSTIRDVYMMPTPINRLMARHNQLFRQLNVHVLRKYDPQRLRLDHSMSQSPWFRVQDIVIRIFSHHVYPSSHSSNCPTPKTKCTFCQTLAVFGPVPPAPPAPVNWVRHLAWTEVPSGAICELVKFIIIIQEDSLVNFKVKIIGCLFRVGHVGGQGHLLRFLCSFLPHFVEDGNVCQQARNQCRKSESKDQPGLTHFHLICLEVNTG
uniref:Uncharacterized protein n=1 Tax=Salix viminalis TaxID=40686 RepID=A0A6N2LGL1_SALVM